MKAAKVLWLVCAAMAVLFAVADAAAPAVDILSPGKGWWNDLGVVIIGVVVLTPLLFVAVVVTVVQLWLRRRATRAARATSRT